MKELEKLKKDVEKEVGLVAAEFSYAKDLQNNLNRIESEEPESALKDAKKGFMILRYVGRGQRKVHRTEQDIVGELKVLGKMLPLELKKQEEDYLSELSIADNKLIKAASIFSGELRKDLLKIRTNEELLRKIKGKAGQKVRDDLARVLRDAKQGVAELITWLVGMQAVLKNIKSFEQTLESNSQRAGK